MIQFLSPFCHRSYFSAGLPYKMYNLLSATATWKMKRLHGWWNHGTIKEAVGVGTSAGAYRIIFTHFSQRFENLSFWWGWYAKKKEENFYCFRLDDSQPVRSWWSKVSSFLHSLERNCSWIRRRLSRFLQKFYLELMLASFFVGLFMLFDHHVSHFLVYSTWLVFLCPHRIFFYSESRNQIWIQPGFIFLWFYGVL